MNADLISDVVAGCGCADELKTSYTSGCLVAVYLWYFLFAHTLDPVGWASFMVGWVAVPENHN